MEENVFPCIVTEYYPIRVTNKYSIFLCNSIEDIQKVLELYREDMGYIIRNVKLDQTVITYEYKEDWSDDADEWYSATANIEKLYNLNTLENDN